MVPGEQSALVLRELVEQYLPAEVAVTELHRSMRRTTLGALAAGSLLTLLGHFVHALGGLLGIGIFVLLIAIFPAVWLALLTVEDRSARRKRPREREALLAGGYRDVAIETRRITLRGASYLGVGVLVQVKDGTVVTLWVGKDGYAPRPPPHGAHGPGVPRGIRGEAHAPGRGVGRGFSRVLCAVQPALDRDHADATGAVLPRGGASCSSPLPPLSEAGGHERGGAGHPGSNRRPSSR